MSLPNLITSDEPGAPVLNNTLGAVCEVLDTALVNGFNVRSCTIAVSAGVATVTASSHGYLPNRVIGIDGATPPAVNGRKAVTILDANRFTFAAPGVPDGTVSGSTTCRRPGLGWSIKFSAPNRRIYERPDPGATAMLLYVDESVRESVYNSVEVIGLESATGIDARGPTFPTTARFVRVGAWSPAPRQWSVVGNSRIAFMHIADFNAAEVAAVDKQRTMWFFGDALPAISYDSHHCLLSAHVERRSFGQGAAVSSASTISVVGAPNGQATTICRAHTQIDGPVASYIVSPYANLGETGGATLPPLLDFTASSVAISEPGSSLVHTMAAAVHASVRGRLPGIATVLNSLRSATDLHLFAGEYMTYDSSIGSVALVRLNHNTVVAYSLTMRGWE